MTVARSEFGSFAHLAERFVGSLWPAGPGRGGDAWAELWLSPNERDMWRRLPGADRRHAVGVARDVVAALPRGTLRTEIVAAALLHDAGKVQARLGTFGRVAATVAAIGWGRERVGDWAGRASGWRARAGRYVTHDRLGAAMLADAGSAEFVVAWAGEHHLPVERWTVDPSVGEILKAADGD